MNSRLKELFDYDPETGVFTRKIKTANRTKIGDIAGSENAMGYLVFMVDGKLQLAHRMAYLYVHGFLPDRVDHIDGDIKNNRTNNLRECSHQQNQQNSKCRTTNRLGVKGVTLLKWGYRAQIRRNGKNIYLGLFKTVEEASAAYTKAAKEVHGEFYREEIAA